MDPKVIVDASVWVSWLIQGDALHGPSDQWLTEYIARQGRLVEPIILLGEIAGAVSRRVGQPARAHVGLARLLALPELQLVAIDEALGMATARVAANFRLRGADAVYVALAQSLNIPLITWDGEQQQRTAGQVLTYTPATYIF